MALTTLLAACNGAGASPASTGTGGKPVNGGTATVAELVGNSPNYIFPFLSIQYLTTSNTTTFQAMMYRPLYWFGNGSSPGVNYSLSLADPPQWSADHKTVTIHLKDYKWSNGTTLTPQNVAFWLGLDMTEKQNLASYTKGGLPDNLAGVSYSDSAGTVTMHLKTAISPTYFLYSQLVQITPLPLAWDLTGAGQPGQCASEQQAQQLRSCPQVYKYLTGQAKIQTTYASNPLWQVVDGPFRLSSYIANGAYAMAPNKKYSGPVKPRLAAVKFLPFTSDTAEYNQLRSGSNISIGYVPAQNLAPKPVTQEVGRNPVTGYTMHPVNWWGVNYLLINFNSNTAGPLLRQLYVRQALQTLVNQDADVEKAYNGYGYASYGPVPRFPANPFVDAFESKNPYPFSIPAARRLLQSHGWTIPSSGPATCSHPGQGAGECGAGISAGEKLQLKLESFSGTTSVTEIMEELVSDAGQAGVHITLDQVPVHQMLADAVQCKPSQASCGWQLMNYGGSVYSSPYPTGQNMFRTGGSQNIGSYSSPILDHLIDQTIQTDSPTAMSEYQNYAAQQIPVLWQPFSSYPIAEVVNNLHGVEYNPLLFINPENWYFTK